MPPIPRKIFSTKPLKKGVYTPCFGVVSRHFIKRLKDSFRRCQVVGLVGALALIGGCDNPTGSATSAVRINAAASIAHVIEDLSEAIEQDLGITITVNSGGSGILAQQITRGGQADLFISADTAWMDQLSKQGLIDTTTRADLAGNRLVLVALTDSTLHPESLKDMSQDRYQPIAVGDPAYVPAGRYAMQAFESHGLDSGSELNLAEAPNVRAALAFVLTGQCPVGLVYTSDTQGSDEIKVLLTIDPTHHDTIRYPAAVLTDAPNREQALRVLDWLKSTQAQLAFQTAGFVDP